MIESLSKSIITIRWHQINFDKQYAMTKHVLKIDKHIYLNNHKVGIISLQYLQDFCYDIIIK